MEAKTRSGIINSLDPYSSVDHIQEMVSFYKDYQQACKDNKILEENTVDKFMTSDYRIRGEEFGAVVAFGTNIRLLLDDAGFRVMLQLSPKTKYDLSVTNIDWNGLNPSQFLSVLAAREIIAVE